MNTRRGFCAATLVLLLGTLTPTTASAVEGVPALHRWLGAEGGYDETACWGPGVDCPGFGASWAFGEVDARPTGILFEDPDGQMREWPARTGNYLFLADVAGGAPGYALLTTAGSTGGPAPAGTISFAFQVHTLPKQPIVIFQHDGSSVPAESVILSLLPDGRLTVAARTGALALTEQAISPTGWHEVTLSYDDEPNSTLRMIVDDQPAVTGALPLGGPNGTAMIGIVQRSVVPFTIGFDDYVESTEVNAPISGARIDYLMPLGELAGAGWKKNYPNKTCKEVARNWQFVAEDQSVDVFNPDGGVSSCNLGGSGIETTLGGTVDEYITEGIPSGHVPSETYKRNLQIRPGSNDLVLALRGRFSGKSNAPNAEARLDLVGGGSTLGDKFTLVTGDTPWTMWTRQFAATPSGQAWTSGSLASTRLRLTSVGGDGPLRYISSVRLDYVWVPRG